MSGWDSIPTPAASKPGCKRQRTLRDILGHQKDDAEDDLTQPIEDYSGDFTTVVPPLKPVFKIHQGDAAAWDLEVGPLWSVAVESLSSADVTGHCQALTCTPNKGKKDSGFGPPKPFHIGFVNGDRLFMPPHYAAAAFPHARTSLSRSSRRPSRTASRSRPAACRQATEPGARRTHRRT